MKTIFFSLLAISLLIGVSLAQSSTLSAQAPSQESNSFSGTVVKSGDKYVLQVGSMTYQLDDQDKAKQFEGKQVKVNGSLDKATSTIHITDIQPVPEK